MDNAIKLRPIALQNVHHGFYFFITADITGDSNAVDFLHDKKIDSEVIKRVLGKRPDDYRHDDLDATRNECPAAGPDAA